MVLSEINENIAVSEKKMENNLESMPATQKLFSCAEIERSIGLRLTETIETMENKSVDPAIMGCSSNIRLTRYNREELMALRDSKLSTVTPACLFEPKIVQFKIMDTRTENEHIHSQLKLFTERVRQLDVKNFDPSLLHLFNNYQKSILNPDTNVPNPFVMQPQQQPRHASFLETHQAALLDKIPPYDRNNNFFDTITTTTAMPHPLQSRANANAYSSYQNRPPPTMILGRNNNCAMDKNNASGKSSNGYFSDNDNTKASFNASMSDEKSKELSEKKAEPKENLVNDEEAPEWYSTPATLNDFVDLHGFEEGLDDAIENMSLGNNRSPNPNSYGTASLAYRRSGYSQNRYAPRVNNNNNYFNAGPPQYGNNNPNYYNQQNFNTSVNQRFRNPLHYQKQPPTMQSPNWPTPTINPFFDLWKRTRANPNENCSFQALMNHHRVQIPPNVPSITDIESALKSATYLPSMMNKGPQSPLAQAQSVPQFFNNWQQTKPTGNGMMPTQEQLHKHTTEIMRNAIMRKNQQQHYHDEKPSFR